MTPEELDFGDSNYADDSIEVIAKLKEEITQANHRYADLQNICDDQDKEIKRLEGLPRTGLYGKYIIQKADRSPVDPKADYFVLRLDTDPAARRAVLEYSYLIREDRELALDLQRRVTAHEKGDECVELKGEIKRLEDALVEERARRSVAAGAECFFRTPIKGSILSKCDKGIYCDWTTCPIKEEKKQDAREQLRAERVIR